MHPSISPPHEIFSVLIGHYHMNQYILLTPKLHCLKLYFRTWKSEKMKSWLIIGAILFGFIFFTSPIFVSQAEETANGRVQLKNLVVSLRSVDYLHDDNSSDTYILFRAVVEGKWRDVSVEIDSVELMTEVCECARTRLHLIGVEFNYQEELMSQNPGWITPERVEILVANDNTKQLVQDLRRWQQFLDKIKREKARGDKTLLTPIRVLPPLNE